MFITTSVLRQTSVFAFGSAFRDADAHYFATATCIEEGQPLTAAITTPVNSR
jgi:hypothetical protein